MDRLPLNKITNMFLFVVIVSLIIIFSAGIAMATSHSEEERMTPSNQMNRQMAARDGKPTEIQLNDGQQNMMLTGVAGVFIIIPVGIWIISHQRKRNRRRQEES